MGGHGSEPDAGLVFDGNGNLYGTTLFGGGADDSVVFELTPGSSGWTETVLHSFMGGADGRFPCSSLIFDGNGNLYGTASSGGDQQRCEGYDGCGVVFELTPGTSGWTERVLYSFDYPIHHDGAYPVARLVFDKVGNLYGTTFLRGAFGDGVIFQLTPYSNGKWSERILHAFTGGKDGAGPDVGLVFDAAGNLYGTALAGGAGYGTAFKLTPTSTGGWTFRTLHQFMDHPGAHPRGDLVVDGAGNIYGTTEGDSKTTFGSVWEITP
jgi:uncharacterized repeat protein (TIGR03803 family)